MDYLAVIFVGFVVVLFALIVWFDSRPKRYRVVRVSDGFETFYIVQKKALFGWVTYPAKVFKDADSAVDWVRAMREPRTETVIVEI